MRRASYSIYLGLILATVSCAQIEAPVWYVQADEDLTLEAGQSGTARALEELGYEVARYNPNSGMITTFWKHGRRMFGAIRYRALVRVKPDLPFGVAVSVPLETYDGSFWAPNGEEEDRRKELVASLAARLRPPSEPTATP